MAYQSVNPFSGKLLKRFDQHTDLQMESALATADTAFRKVWSAATFRDRAKFVGGAASLMSKRKDSLARLATVEMGKRISEARDEVELSAAILRYYADHAETFLAPQVIDSTVGDARLEFSPLGVLIGVQPWNFPYYQLARFAAPNLMAPWRGSARWCRRRATARRPGHGARSTHAADAAPRRKRPPGRRASTGSGRSLRRRSARSAGSRADAGRTSRTGSSRASSGRRSRAA